MCGLGKQARALFISALCDLQLAVKVLDTLLSGETESAEERDRRDGATVKSACNSCDGPGLISQPPHGSSQPPRIPGPGDLMPFSDLCRHQAYMWANTHIKQ